MRVTFPLCLNAGVIQAPAQPAAVRSGNGLVLLVEDEEAVRGPITMLLEMIGYDVIGVGSAEEAIDLPLEPVPDLLLSDFSLPGLTGSALGAYLRNRWPSLKVILMSGYLDEAFRENASKQSWKFLQKPFEIEDLASVLDATMSSGLGSEAGWNVQ